MRYFSIGEIVGPQGIKGEVKVYPLTDDLGRFSLYRFIKVFMGDEEKNLFIHQARPHKNIVLVKFDGIDDRDSAEALRGGLLKIAEAGLPPLAENEYHLSDLYDMEVETIEGEVLGIIAEIIATGANDVYAVRDSLGGQLLIPAIKECIRKVDVENCKMTVALLPGLREAAKG